jgi:hypothetical protein
MESTGPIQTEYKIEVRLTKWEIARYNFYHIRWLVLLDAIGFAVLLGFVFVSLVNPDPGFRNMLKIAIMWGVLILAVGLSQPLILFLQVFVLKSPAVESQMEPRVYTFDDSGIHIKAGPRHATTLWLRIVEIKDIPKLLLIYTNPKLAYIIPKRYFESRREMLRFIRTLLERVQRNSEKLLEDK